VFGIDLAGDLKNRDHLTIFLEPFDTWPFLCPQLIICSKSGKK